MRGLISWLGLLGTLAVAGLSASAAAQPVGSEFQINTYTRSSQGDPAVASDASRNFVVVWSGSGQGDPSGVFGQRYDSGGARLGSEFRVNSYTTNGQSRPSVASNASGNFVVVWDSWLQDGSYYGIFGQRYDSAGVAQGAEFRVNSYTTSIQILPSVASDATGDFVVVWNGYGVGGDGSYGVFGQRFDNTGGPLGREFRVGSSTPSLLDGPSVASDATGNFAVVSESFGQDGSDEGIFGQRYDSGGVAQGDEFQVNTYTTGNQRAPSIASDASGNFVVAWTSNGQDGSGYGVFGQRYDSGGVAQGSEFQINTSERFAQLQPAAASDASGNFLVVWTGYDESAGGVFGQRYDSEGVAQGAEFQINTFTPNNQNVPTLKATGPDQFVVAWTSSGQDESGYGVFGQRFNFVGEASVTVVSPNTNVKWRIGSIQLIKWTHNLGLGETFRIELDRDDDGTFEELIADDAPVDSTTKASFVWTVTGPPSATVRVRVSWTNDLSVSDTSDATFQIRPVG